MAISHEEYKNKYGKQINSYAQTWAKNNELKSQQENKKKKKWFQSGAFADGYQVGDVTKTIFGTGADLALDAFKGVANIGDSAAKLIAGGTAEVADAFGADKFANKVRNNIKTKENPLVKGISNVDNKIDKNSVTGEILDSAVEGVGYYTGMAALQSVGVPWQLTAGVTSAGGELQNAYANDAKGIKALVSAGISAGAEIGSEYLSGGLKLPGTGKTLDTLTNGLTDKISNKAVQVLTKYGINALGEGAEEIISGLGTMIGQKLTYMNDKKLSEIYSKDEALEEFVVGALTSAISGAPSTINGLKNSRVNQTSSNIPIQSNTINNLENTIVNQSINNKINENNLMPKRNNKTNNIISETNQQMNDTQQLNKINSVFSQQVDEVLNGTYPKENMLVVSENTPKVLQDIGLKNFPITITQRHLKTITNPSGNYQGANYHNLGVDVVKQLPNAIANPLNILKSDTKSDSIVVITELADNQDRPIIASIKIDGKGIINDIEIDSNVMTSAYGRNNYDKFMRDNIAKGNLLYDIDEGIIKRSDGKLQLRPITSSTNNNSTTNQQSQIAPLPINSNMQQNQNNTQQKIPTSKDINIPKINTNNIKLPILNLNNNNNIENQSKNPTKEESYVINTDKLTRKEVRQQLLDEMNIAPAELSIGNDISSINYQITDPIRVNEKVFGRELGKKINDATINQTKHNEAERTRWLKQEREEISELQIKPRSKESAAVQKYAEKQYIGENNSYMPYGDIELANEFPNVDTQNKIKNAAKVLRNKYDLYIDNINKVITSLGYDPIPKRTDYMRHFQELGDIFSQTGIPFNLNDMKAEDLPTDINGLTEYNRPGKNWFASAQKRTGLKTIYDAITGIDGYLEGASNLIFHTKDIQNYRALSSLIRDTFGQVKGFDNLNNLKDNELRQRIEDIQNNKLSKYVAWLDEQANSLANKKGAIDRGVERAIGRRGYTFFNTIKKQVGSNMTGYNVRSSLTNLISSTLAASKTNKIAFVKGTISTINNMFHNDGFIEKSDFLTTRFGSDALSTKLWQKISNAGQIFMSGTDYFTSNQIVRSKYYEGIQKGLNETDAIKYADDFASRVMGDRSKGSTAEIFNSKTLGLFTQFQLEVNNQWQYMVHDTKMDYQSNSDVNGGLKAGATMLFQLGQLAGYSYFFNELFEKLTGSRAAFDPIEILKKLFGLDDDKEKSWGERINNAKDELIENIPFASILNGGRIPIAEALPINELLTGKDKNGNDKSRLETIKETIPYYVMPTGYSQLKKTLKGLSMYNKDLPVSGSYTDSGNLRFKADESASGKLKSALFGQYSSKEAQDYIDSGFKTINKNNIQEMKELGMSSSEYRKYRSGLATSGTTNEDKMNYIRDLKNVSDEQKSIMASNILRKKVDYSEYKKYNSYAEFDYAYKYPEKYSVISNITTYDKYQTYKKELQNIRDNTKDDKNETIKYINSLKLSIPQKAIFIKQYYKSFNNYNDQIVDYIKKNVKDVQERENILTELGFTIRNGKVYW